MEKLEKNTISLLQERLVKEKIPPNYIFIQLQKTPPLFEAKCVVTYQGQQYEKTGQGGRKKDAQVEAAKAILDVLQSPSQVVEMRPQLEPNLVDMVEQNPVGTQPIQELIVFCCKENLDKPEFLNEPMQGSLFLVKCRVGDVEFSGSCTTKKSAKRAAAINVYAELKRRRLAQPEVSSELKKKETAVSSSSDEAKGSIKNRSEFAKHLSKHEGKFVKELLAFSNEIMGQNSKNGLHAQAPKYYSNLFGDWLKKHTKGPKGFFDELKKELKLEEEQVIHKSEFPSKHKWIVVVIANMPQGTCQETDPLKGVAFGDDVYKLLEEAVIEIVAYIGTEAVREDFGRGLSI